MNDASSPWLVYVLECENGSLYTGVTNDLERRLKAHHEGKGARYTRMYPPRRVLTLIPAASRSEALGLEIWFKRKTREAKDLFIRSGTKAILKKWRKFKKEREGTPARYPWQKQSSRKKRSQTPAK